MKQNNNPKLTWQGFHWSFFINIQGLILALRRFEHHLDRDEIYAAKQELITATDLMLASSASMILAGSFSKQEYEEQVRSSMTPPYVKSADFSGLMSWEHSALIRIWKKLTPIFTNLPSELQVQHEGFTAAYLNLAEAHKAVCAKFGGADSGSLRFQGNNALETLDKFASNRESLINPKSKEKTESEKKLACPFH